MISKNEGNLYLFLTEWKNSCLTPKNIYSTPLYECLATLCEVFNSCTFKSYLKDCNNFLVSAMTNTSLNFYLPKCMIAIKTRELAIWLKNLDYFNDENLKNFYIGSTLYLSTISDFDVFNSILKSMFVLLQSETDNKNCAQIRNELSNDFKSLGDLKGYIKSLDGFTNNFSHLMESSKPKLSEDIQFFETLSQSEDVLKLCTFSIEFYEATNPSKCKDFCNDLILLCSHSALWVNFSRNNVSFKIDKPGYEPVNTNEKLDVITFFQQNVETVENSCSTLKILLSQQKQPEKNKPEKSEKNKKKEKNKVEANELFENWMGLGKKIEFCEFQMSKKIIFYPWRLTKNLMTKKR